MPENTRDYIEEAQSEAQFRFGRNLSADELAEKFVGHDLEARVQHLKTLKTPAEYADGLDHDLTVAEAAERYTYTSALKSVHEKLRKVGR